MRGRGDAKLRITFASGVTAPERSSPSAGRPGTSTYEVVGVIRYKEEKKRACWIGAAGPSPGVIVIDPIHSARLSAYRKVL